MDYKQLIAKSVAKAATNVIFENNDLILLFKKNKVDVVDCLSENQIEVDFSSNQIFGDYSTNIALVQYRMFAQSIESHVPNGSNLGAIWASVAKNPRELAEKIVSKIDSDIFDKVEVAGPGFINFWFKNDVLVNNLIAIDTAKENYGKSNLGEGKLAIVEYSSPNIAKPFGVGHLRSTVIGDSVASLMESLGYKVMRDNHLGDWGTQFGKVICAIKKWGNEEDIEKSESPVNELVNLYVKYHEESKVDPKLDDEARLWFKKLEDGDTETKRLWQKCVDWSWVEFQKIYDLLGIKFDESFNNGRGLGESFFESRMAGVIKELEENKLLKEGEDGAKLVFFADEKYPPLMILKKDGTTLYSTRDLATDKYRLEKYNPEIVINEVGSEQSLYFKQLYEIEKILGWYKEGQRVHVGHGLFLLDGKKMSTRAGKTVKLDEVLVEAIERAKKLGNTDDETAKQVGIGAIKYFDLSHQPMTNINFDWDSMFSMDGNSSPYIQYTVARINSLVAKGKVTKNLKIEEITLNDEETAILRKLAQFQEIIVTAAKSYSPNILCNYLYDLASKFNTLYNKHKIVGSEEEEFRLLLSKGTAQVLKNGLKLLGIDSPERM
ncbi:MAG: arginine--tRNA ligase [Microgenomates group bacterium]